MSRALGGAVAGGEIGGVEYASSSFTAAARVDALLNRLDEPIDRIDGIRLTPPADGADRGSAGRRGEPDARWRSQKQGVARLG